MKKYVHVAVYLFVLFSLTLVSDSQDVVPPRQNQDDKFLPNDPLLSHQWGIGNSEGFDIDGIAAWGIERGNRGIAIAILDTGIDLHHPDLINNLWTNPNEIPNNGKDDDNNGYIDDIHGINAITGTGDPSDDNGHGTHVAGIIGAEGNNGIGIAGVMHEVSLISCKFLDSKGAGKTKDAVRCLDYIADLASRECGVTIVATTNAWGGGSYDDELLDAILEHRDLGILFVADAGGSARDLDDAQVFPASYDAANIIVAAKADSDGELTKFSNYGANSVHVAAPGLDLISTTLHGGYEARSGSSAAGFVSGIIGLMSAHRPELGWAQLKHSLMASTEKLASADSQKKTISGGFVSALKSLTF